MATQLQNGLITCAAFEGFGRMEEMHVKDVVEDRALISGPSPPMSADSTQRREIRQSGVSGEELVFTSASLLTAMFTRPSSGASEADCYVAAVRRRLRLIDLAFITFPPSAFEEMFQPRVPLPSLGGVKTISGDPGRAKLRVVRIKEDFERELFCPGASVYQIAALPHQRALVISNPLDRPRRSPPGRAAPSSLDKLRSAHEGSVGVRGNEMADDRAQSWLGASARASVRPLFGDPNSSSLTR
ncbi:hypothetical protein EYF80_030910 [Liparis tanakae]|uniref:Uncharacterized protein n=1 Tax=Liparis tanakae TaxID=230148 RepID=A0A4Z2H081_9TELE|nr:hypothetical protein EYF80_030910 [Liparis tanakae]